uniref:S27A3 protein n=1 Tax=Junco hyemalis TaxID=40217 RepID=A0A8C5NMN1_JUNHY
GGVPWGSLRADGGPKGFPVPPRVPGDSKGFSVLTVPPRGSRCSRGVPSGPKEFPVLTVVPRVPGGPGGFPVVLGGSRWSQGVPGGPKGFLVLTLALGRSQGVPGGPEGFPVVLGGSRWSQGVPGGPKGFLVVPRGSWWSQGVPSGPGGFPVSPRVPGGPKEFPVLTVVPRVSRWSQEVPGGPRRFPVVLGGSRWSRGFLGGPKGFLVVPRGSWCCHWPWAGPKGFPVVPGGSRCPRGLPALTLPPQRPAERQHRLRLAVGSGLRPDVWRSFQRRFGPVRVVETYGMSEGNVTLFNYTGTPGAVGRCSALYKLFSPFEVVRYDVAAGAPERDRNGRCIRARTGEQRARRHRDSVPGLF